VKAVPVFNFSVTLSRFFHRVFNKAVKNNGDGTGQLSRTLLVRILLPARNEWVQIGTSGYPGFSGAHHCISTFASLASNRP
jgi:hypothetical protein